jgi:glycosyltransferase involved in cell wall biosynthesis
MARDPRVKFIAVSQAIRARAIEFGIPKDSIQLLYTGIDTISFTSGAIPIENRENVVLFIGRLVENKGVEILLRAAHKVKSHIKDIKLIIIGDGPLRSSLERLSNSLDVEAEFTGSMPPDYVIKALHRAKLLCQPSITIDNGESEAFGMVLLEAQACGVPVISSARGGSKEGLLEGRTGYSFPESNISKLSEIIEMLIKDDNKLRDLSRAATAFVKDEFDIRARTSALEDIYLLAVGAPHTSRSH